MEMVDIDKLDALSRLRRRVAQLSPQTSHSIHKVQRRLRDVNNKSYEPEMIAIGPYHHGKNELKKMEELKVRYMQSLLDRKPDVDAERYLSAIAEVGKKAQDCYAEPVSLSAAEFIEMLVLDGCFIIELIGAGRKNQNDRTFHGLERDLVLLENQIPFFVLCELFDLIEGPEKHTLLMRRVLAFCRNVFPGNVMYNPGKRSDEVKHILDLIHSNWYPFPHNTSTATQASRFGLIIPSAAQLKDANVKFKKKEYDRGRLRFHTSRGTTVFDIEFKEDKGVMLMPTLRISDGTESVLRNLIAFEQYLPSHEPARITDYALLLDGLISSSKDVQILSQYELIENHLGSEEAVADFVNRLTKNVFLSQKQFLVRGYLRPH
ncbi:hypothetical protein ACS0TY_010033 [Phlomoides rotata]